MGKKWQKQQGKKIVVIFICLLLILVHSIWSQIKFDSINIWLGIIVIALLLLPDMDFLLPYFKRIKRFKAWELEFELNDLEEKVDQAQEENLEKEVPSNIPPEVDEILKEASKDPRAALLLLSSKIDSAVINRFNEADIDIRRGSTVPRFPSTVEAIRIGIEKNLFPPSALSAYKDFVTIRNKIAHDYQFEVDTNKILSTISLGTQLLKIFSTGIPNE